VPDALTEDGEFVGNRVIKFLDVMGVNVIDLRETPFVGSLSAPGASASRCMKLPLGPAWVVGSAAVGVGGTPQSRSGTTGATT
jgi:hypothetical protein